MKKCIKCDILYSLDERTRCLYCNTLLTTDGTEENSGQVDAAGMAGMQTDSTIIDQLINDRQKVAHDRKQHIVGSYFCSRTFYFMYSFSRHDFHRGKGFRRWLVKPLNMGSFLIIPWVVVDLLDSLYIRLFYNAVCPTCGWKYKSVFFKIRHNPRDCAYNLEYAQIVEDILTGKIIQKEEAYLEKACQEKQSGRRSAYRALCANKNLFTGLLDVTCIWFSISLFFLLLITVVVPWLSKVTNSAEMPKLYLR